jgi:hypothetical protein
MPHGWTIVPNSPPQGVGNVYYDADGTCHALIKLDDDLEKAKKQVKDLGGRVKDSLVDAHEKQQGKKPHPLPIP